MGAGVQIGGRTPDGSKLVYNRRGTEEYDWKRYNVGRCTDIWLYDIKANSSLTSA